MGVAVTEPLLKVEKVSCTYRRKYSILNEVSFEIYENEAVGLMGDSGAGKSSLARILLQLQNADSGTIFFQNRAVQNTLEFRKKVQIVFQDASSTLNPNLIVYYLVEEGLKIHFPLLTRAERRLRVESLLKRVGLEWEHAFRAADELSGGQKQRVSLARALASEPQLLILDEPLSQLDMSIQADILKLLIQLQKETKIAYLFISHDEETVKYFCHRILKLQHGRLTPQSSI